MTAPEKPAYGSPCNGCGQCCQDQLCPLGARVFKRWRGPCPALEGKDEAFVCGLVMNPRRYAPARTACKGAPCMSNAAALLIGAGCGCDGWREDETPDPEARARMMADGLVAAKTKTIARARRAWGA